ncbi:hypothetical protein [Bradyrhizobium sp. S3.14.4]
MERLLRQADIDETNQLALVRIAWCREISQPPAVNDPAKILALIGFAAKAHAAGAIDLAANLLWRAAQRCWWSSASDELCARVYDAAARQLPDGDPRLIAISAYVEPLRRGADLYFKLQGLAGTAHSDPTVASILGSTANVIGTFDIGVNFLAESSAVLRMQGRLSDLARVLFAQGWAEMEVGDWRGAMREAEESARLAEETGGLPWIAAATILKARLAGMQGNLEQSEAYAAQAEALALSIGASFLLTMLQIARGVSAIGAGRHWEAFEHLRRLFTPADPAFNFGLQFFGLADFVEAAVSSGNADEASRVLDEIERASAPTPVPWVGTMLQYGKAFLAAPEDAEPFFLQGLGLQGPGPAAKKWPFLRARFLLAYGGWLRRQRRSANARAPLREARDMFDALGASPWSDRAREELRASGETSRRRTEQVWDTLTPQELHIAQLAAEGLSNKEIGARLYLCPQNRRVPPAPDLFEGRNHLAVRATPRSRQHQPPRGLIAVPSSDWSFDRSGSPSARASCASASTPKQKLTMKLFSSLAILSLGAILMTQAADAAPDAGTDPRIDPQVRAFLREINKDPSPFWELPQPKPQDILTELQNKTPVDMSGVNTTEQTIIQDGQSAKIYIMKPRARDRKARRTAVYSRRRLDRRQFPEPSASVARPGGRLRPDRCFR